jgi:hypothetical protein
MRRPARRGAAADTLNGALAAVVVVVAECTPAEVACTLADRTAAPN